MARIQKRTRKDGSTAYVAKWRTITGQDRSKTFANKRAAEAHLTKVNAGKLRGMEYDPASGGILFREAAQVWLAARTDLKPSTHAAHAERLAPTTDETRARHARLVHNGQPLRIDPTFGDYPLNCITRDDVQAWVNRLVASGRKPSSVRNLFFVVRQVLEQAVVDGRLPVNPAEHVKLPTEHTDWTAAVGGAKAIPASDFGYSDDVLPGDGLPDYEALRVDDPAQFLSAAQVSALVSATPWPYNVFEHVAAWTGLRPGEETGLCVGDVRLAAPGAPPHRTASWIAVERTLAVVGGVPTYQRPKTKGSRRRVPLTSDTVEMLRSYLAVHPRAHEPSAPLFPAFKAVPLRLPHIRKREPGTVAPSRVPAAVRDAVAELRASRHEELPPAARQAAALAGLSVDEAAARLTLDWTAPLRADAFRKQVFAPAVLRANRIAQEAAEVWLQAAQNSVQTVFALGEMPPTLPDGVTVYSLRHTYASLSVAAGIGPLALSRRMGHAKVTTTMNVYAHLFEDSHADDMAALGALAVSTPTPQGGNIIRLRG